MSPQEKAKELVDKFEKSNNEWLPESMRQGKESRIVAAKQSALIAVEEILEVVTDEAIFWDCRNYWQQVKEEIEKP